MKEFNDLTRQEKETCLMLPILKELRRLGGQATTEEIKRGLFSNDYGIPEEELTRVKEGKNGPFKTFNIPFSFTISNLAMAGFVDHPKRGTIVLTQKGRSFEGNSKQLADAVYKISLPMWKEKAQKNKLRKKDQTDQDEQDQVQDLSGVEEDPWRDKLINALNGLTPGKFEMFCRALVRHMNVDIDETIGVKQSGYGGVDGFGYMMADDFRTSSVAIQAKRWSTNPVSSPEIDKFRGAMDKYRADYGIFITTSSFSKDAIKAARMGTRIITLIDGERLVDLVAKYELYVTPVVTYELGEFFTDDN